MHEEAGQPPASGSSTAHQSTATSLGPPAPTPSCTQPLDTGCAAPVPPAVGRTRLAHVPKPGTPRMDREWTERRTGLRGVCTCGLPCVRGGKASTRRRRAECRGGRGGGGGMYVTHVPGGLGGRVHPGRRTPGPPPRARAPRAKGRWAPRAPAVARAPRTGKTQKRKEKERRGRTRRGVG